MRKFSFKLIPFFLFFTSPFVIVQDSDGLEEVTVTAQRQEQSLQSVPLSVSSLDNDDILARQIEEAKDLQMFIPGLRFGGNIGVGGGQFEIRGMTNGATSGTSDAGVAVHINDMAVGIVDLASGGIFDMQRVEVIRGPAGTLYGRNAIGGSINFITAKADTSGFYGSSKVDLGDYGRFGTESVFNVPLDDSVALRIATYSLKQDPLIENIYSKGQDIDNRNQSAYRLTLTFDASDNTTINVVHSAALEDSTRNVAAGSWCDRDPSLVVGCTQVAPENQKFEIANPMSTFVENLLVAQGVLAFTPITDMSGAPQQFWQVNLRGTPMYTIDEYLTQILIDHGISDELFLSVAASRKDRNFNRREAWESPELDTLRFLDSPATPGGLGTMSDVFNPACSVEDYTAGWFGGCILDIVNNPVGAFAIMSEQITDSVEMKLVSSFDGPHNFLFGMNYYKTVGDTNTDVVASGLDALTKAPAAALVGAQLNALGIQLYAPHFRTANLDTIESSAVFGEYYYQANEDVKITLGLRYTDDFKEALPSNPFINVFGYQKGFMTDALAGMLTGGQVPSAAAWEALFCPAGGAFCPAGIPGREGLSGPGEAYKAAGFDTTLETSKFTGRFVVDYFINSDSMMFVSLSKGFKGGGINPGFDPAAFAGVPTGFPDAGVWNVEIGFKNEFPDQGIRFNVSAYASQVENYHIGKIINRTTINEGIDVDITGLEAELLVVPPEVPGLSFNASISLTNSSIADGEKAIDVINRDLQLSGGGAEWHLMKDEQSETYIVKKTALAAMWQTYLQEVTTFGAATTLADGIAALNPAFDGLSLVTAVFFNPIEHHGDRTFGEPTPVSYFNPFTGAMPADGHLPSLGNRLRNNADFDPLRVLAQLHGFDLVAGTDISEGLETDLSGNSLYHPESQISLGLGYLQDVGEIKINYRLDYYVQGQRYNRVYNLASDYLEGWDELGAQITVSDSDDSWFVQFYGQNITDNESIYYRNLESTAVGNYQRIMARERARYGVRAGWNF